MTTTISRSYSPVLSVKADQKTIVSQLFRSLKSGKVCRVCFFVNGDKHFHGLHYVVNVDRIRTLDTLCAELSRLLVTVKTLPSGVRIIFNSQDGSKLQSIHELSHNEYYVCSSNEHFIRLNYLRLRKDLMLYSTEKSLVSLINRDHITLYNQMVPNGKSVNIPGVCITTSQDKRNTSGGKKRQTLSTASSNSYSTMSPTLSSVSIRPKIIALLRGSCRGAPAFRPSRRAFRFLINQRIAQNYEQLLNEISKCVKLNVGAVHRICAFSTSKKITCLEDFLDEESVYLVYGRSEKCSSFDFMLDEYEKRDVTSIVGSGSTIVSTADLKCCKINKNRKIRCNTNNKTAVNKTTNCTNKSTNDTKKKKPLQDNDMKTSSLPRNFHTSCKNHKNSQQNKIVNGENKENINSTPCKRVGGGSKRTTKLSKLESNQQDLSDCTNSARFVSLYSLEDSSDKHFTSHNNSTNKYSNSEYYLATAAATTEDNGATKATSPYSNNLVYCKSTNEYNCGKLDDMSANQPCASGSSTPGATSSVSCSEEFTYASLDVSNENCFENGQKVYCNHLQGEEDGEEECEDGHESSDSSTPSFSSQSYIAPYPDISSSIQSTPLQNDFEDKFTDSLNSQTNATQILIENGADEHNIASITEDDKQSDFFIPKKEVNKLYSVGDVIGDGKFGVVYTCIHRSTRKSYAMKVVDKCTMQQMMQNCHKGPNLNMNSEATILQRIEHPNIVKLYDHFEFADQTYLILELLKGGDLFDAVSIATRYSESEAAEMVNDLVSAISYLHKHNIVHRDIKLENLMVDFVPISSSTRRIMNQTEVPRRYRQMIKLTDFGLAVDVKHKELLYTVCGTPIYVAPEILLEIGYSFPVDIWAAGVIAYILLCGYPPFNNEENDQDKLFDQIIAGKFEFASTNWADISDSAKQMIRSMLCVDQTKRLSAEQVLNHKWMRTFL